MRPSGTIPSLLALLATAATAQAAPQLVVFGDSYSLPARDGVRDWPLLLRDAGLVGRVADFAASGTTAMTRRGPDLAREIGRWEDAGRPLGVTVVYLGYNDIGGDMARARAGYLAAIRALVDAGAASGRRRLLLVEPHDLGGTPLFNRTAERGFLRRETRAWDAFVARTARRVGATPVDLFAAFDRVLADPGRYGFTDVTTADRARSGGTALYREPFHVGQRGQAIIARTIAARLGGQLAARRLADARAGLAALDEAPAQGTDAPGGLAAFQVGDPAPEAAPGADDPGRAGFAQAYPASPPGGGGLGVAYVLDDGTVLGVVLTRYAEAARVPLAGGGAATLASDGVQAHLGRRLGPLALDGDLAYGRDRYAVSLGGGHADYGGRTVELAQRAGLPLEAGGGLTVTPWAGLAYRAQDGDGEASSAGTLGSLGLDVALAPVRLGRRASLGLRAGLSYTRDLAGGVAAGSAPLAGEDDGAVPAGARAVDLTLGASLAVGRRLAVDGGVTLERDAEQGAAGEARLRVAWRF